MAVPSDIERQQMNNSVFITCALTGAGDTYGKSPHLPVTPKEIADSGLEAAAAGAAILHIHVRDPQTGKPSRSLEYYREVVARIRDRNSDVLLNLTGGMGGDVTLGAEDPKDFGPGTDLVGPVERIEHILELKPEICSFDCGSLNFEDLLYLTTPTYLRKMATLIRQAGVHPEIEVFDTGHIRLARQLISEGLFKEPYLFQLCLGIRWGADASADGMKAMKDMLPANSIWAGFGLGRAQMPMVAQAVIMGGNVRVGLEDNLFLSKGQPATNAQLVSRAVQIIELLGAEVIKPDAVRRSLNSKN
jgi:uncharacterized protein (DUF849 family)